MGRLPERVHVLGRRESLERLAGGGLGRVALTDRALPLVLPVRFAWHADRVVFGVALGSVLDRATRGTVVGFEADGDDGGNGEWSVSIVGLANHLCAADVSGLGAIDLPRWTIELPDRIVAVWPDLITGRRIAGPISDR